VPSSRVIVRDWLLTDDCLVDPNQVVWLAPVLGLALAGCSTTDDRVAPTPSQPLPDSRCVAATQLNAATSGSISAGPFSATGDEWSLPDGTKFWVSSSVHGPNNGAEIRAQSVDGSATGVVDRRPPEQIARVEGAALFFPGALRLPTKGPWRIEVTIGDDTGCFLLTI
jgi:hypothetical protein